MLVCFAGINLDQLLEKLREQPPSTVTKILFVVTLLVLPTPQTYRCIIGCINRKNQLLKVAVNLYMFARRSEDITGILRLRNFEPLL